MREKVDVYVANLLLGYVKLHNLHWNVVGANFKGVHEYLEELYDDFTEKYDEVAEIQRQRDEVPVGNVKKYLELSTVEELEDEEVSCKEAIEKALELVVRQRDLALEIREAYEDDCLMLTIAMEDHVVDYNKQIWFMESMLK